MSKQYSTEELETMLAQHADENGEVAPEVMMQIISGEAPAAASGDTDAGKVETKPAEEEASPTSEEAGKKEESATTEQQVKEEPVVLTKDGKHTIPFSVLEELREDLKATKAQNAQLSQALNEQKGLLEQLAQAKEEDTAAGTTEATDNILSALEEDYPGITKVLQQSLIDPLKSELAPLKTAHEADVKQTEEQKAIAAFDKSVADIEPRYMEAKDSKEFWDWFHGQSKVIRAAQNSGDPEVVAEVIKAFYDSKQPTPTAPAGDTAKAKTVVDKVKEAIEKATDRPAVTSLSDIPGGTNPAHDEIEAFKALDPLSMAGKLAGKSPQELEAYLSRIL